MTTVVKCPSCGAEVRWTPENQFRPFCSARCSSSTSAHGPRKSTGSVDPPTRPLVGRRRHGRPPRQLSGARHRPPVIWPAFPAGHHGVSSTRLPSRAVRAPAARPATAARRRPAVAATRTPALPCCAARPSSPSPAEIQPHVRMRIIVLERVPAVAGRDFDAEPRAVRAQARPRRFHRPPACRPETPSSLHTACLAGCASR